MSGDIKIGALLGAAAGSTAAASAPALGAATAAAAVLVAPMGGSSAISSFCWVAVRLGLSYHWSVPRKANSALASWDLQC